MPDLNSEMGRLAHLEQKTTVLGEQLAELKDEVGELLRRKPPWLAILAIILPPTLCLLGLGVQTLIQINVVIEREGQYQRTVQTWQASTQKTDDLQMIEIKELRLQVAELRIKLERGR